MKKVIIALSFLLLLQASLFGDYNEQLDTVHEKIEKQRKELNSLEEQIGQYREYINALDKKEADLLKRMKNIKEEIEEKKYKIKELEEEVEKVNKKIENLNAKLEESRKLHKKYGGYLKGALTEYYYQTLRTTIRNRYSLIFSTCPDDNCYYTEQLVRYPASKYKKIDENIEKYVSLKADLKSEHRNLIDLKEQVVLAQKDFIGKRKKQLTILQNLKSSREKKLEEVKELQDKKDRLNQLVQSLKRKAINLKRLKGIAENFQKAKGQLKSPIEGTVVSKFGKHKHPELDTYVINRGIKIEPAGTKKEVSAVAGGEVIYSDAFEGVGNMVVINHGNNYYTMYGNLEELFVEQGEEIQMFDSVGTLSDDPLYFELGKGSKPLDPGEWLK